MSVDLQTRAQIFVARTVPSELDYVPGSIAERIIAQYAEEGRLDVDSELAEMVELALMEAAAVVDQHEGPARDYMAESAAILDAIYKEI